MQNYSERYLGDRLEPVSFLRDRPTVPPLPGRWSLWIALAGAVSVLYVVLPFSAASQMVAYNGVVLVAMFASWAGARRQRDSERSPWVWTTLAIAGFLVGELLWWGFGRAGMDPYPSVADAVFLVSYVPLAIAASRLARRSEAEPDRSAWIDAGILTAVCGLLVWKVLMEPYAADTSLSGIYRAVTLAYPLADLVVMGFVLKLVLRPVVRTRSGSLFALGALCTLVGDLSFAWLDLRGTYEDGMWVDLVWLAGYLLIGCAALTDDGEQPAPSTERETLGRGRLVVVLAAVAVPLVVILVEVGSMDVDTLTLAVLSATLVSLLVAIRFWGLLRRARRAERLRGEARLAEVVHHSSDAIVLIDRDYRVTFASPAFETFAGADPTTLVGRCVLDWFPSDEGAPDLAAALGKTLGVPLGSVVPFDVVARTADGQSLECEGTVVNLLESAEIQALVVTIRDVSVRRRLEHQLERQAFTDDLTGLANRVLFMDRVSHALERLRRQPTQEVAVLFIDLDDFKAVNDGMGHSAGDVLLRGVAERIVGAVRPGDTVARLGGDEFAVLLEDVSSPRVAERTAHRVKEALGLAIAVLDVEIRVPASVGVALATTDATVETLMRDADIAMYRAKALGKGRVVVFDDALGVDAVDVLQLKVELPGALAAGEFRLVYQPIFQVADQELIGVEALVRWDHPSRGEVQPADFIHIAERSSTIIDLGQWVLDTACAQAAEWNRHAGRELVMSVNVSPVQLLHPRFVDGVRDVLRRTGLATHLLTLEITESVLVDPDRVRALLDDLHAMGVGIAIDDFGTGYSSLSYLRHFPITSVKIDRAFIADLTGGTDVGVIRSILALAETMSLTTVAEGVETAAQLETLESLHCGLAQGFYLGRPQGPHQIDRLVNSSDRDQAMTEALQP